MRYVLVNIALMEYICGELYMIQEIQKTKFALDLQTSKIKKSQKVGEGSKCCTMLFIRSWREFVHVHGHGFLEE